MVEGAYVVQRQTLSLPVLYLSIPFGLLVSLVVFTNNMRDSDYDARQYIKTTSIILGPIMMRTFSKSLPSAADAIVAKFTILFGIMYCISLFLSYGMGL